MTGHGVSVVFRDVLLGVIGILILAFYVVLLQVNPEQKRAEGVTPPGNVTVMITWPTGDTDIDLWVHGPGEPTAVGYSNKGGLLWNLLRDDLGSMPDATPLNYENAYTRGSPAGEYIVNLHCFRCTVLPQKVNVEVGSSKALTGGKGTMVLATASVELKSLGQERTAIRFRLDAKGDLVPGSINSVFKALRSGNKFEGNGGAIP